jgi:hypothetical protein
MRSPINFLVKVLLGGVLLVSAARAIHVPKSTDQPQTPAPQQPTPPAPPDASQAPAPPAPQPTETPPSAPETPAEAPPAPSEKPKANPPSSKAKPGATQDDEEPAKPPPRFDPTEKGKADDDIPFPVDI